MAVFIINWCERVLISEDLLENGRSLGNVQMLPAHPKALLYSRHGTTLAVGRTPGGGGWSGDGGVASLSLRRRGLEVVLCIIGVLQGLISALEKKKGWEDSHMGDIVYCSSSGGSRYLAGMLAVSKLNHCCHH